MVTVFFFHDHNWKIKGYRVQFDNRRYPSRLESKIIGLLAGTRLALSEAKAYLCKADDEGAYEVVVTRANKNVTAILKPLELAIKEMATEYPDEIEVRQF